MQPTMCVVLTVNNQLAIVNNNDKVNTKLVIML